MTNTVRQLAAWVGLIGLITVGLLLIGQRTIGGLLALLQLGGLVGAPLALLLHRQLRSRAVVAVIAPALSIALSALAAQSLVWFDLAEPELIVLCSTAYGVMLAWLLSSEQQQAVGDAAEHAST